MLVAEVVQHIKEARAVLAEVAAAELVLLQEMAQVEPQTQAAAVGRLTMEMAVLAVLAL